MAGGIVTVQGVGAGPTREIVSLYMSSDANLALAQATLGTVTSLVQLFGSTGNLGLSPVDIAPPGLVGSGAAKLFGVVNTANFPAGTTDAYVGALPATYGAFVTNLAGTTTVANDPGATGTGDLGGFTLVSSNGDLVFTDNAAGSLIITGGGSNTITLSASSSNTRFQGDGKNRINFEAASGVASVTGTAASVDSIFGTAATAGLEYISNSGAAAIINPNAANVTIMGGSQGAETVFGGNQTVVGAGGQGTTVVSGPVSTGKLTVFAGEGYFKGGVNGGNVLNAGTAGAATLVGGGAGDILRAGGAGDQLVAGPGASTLDGSNSAGSDHLWAAQDGATTMYGSKAQGDDFFFSSSTVQGSTGGVSFEGVLMYLHHAPDGTTLNSNVSNWVYVGHNAPGAGQYSANFGTVADFISGVDHLQIAGAAAAGAGQGAYSLTYGGANTTLDTGAGSHIVFLNAHLTNSDIGRFN